MTCPPRLNRKVDTATNLMITANELDSNTETYVEYMVEFTGKTREEVVRDIARTRYYTPEKAVEYGIIDKIVHPKSVRARSRTKGRARPERASSFGLPPKRLRGSLSRARLPLQGGMMEKKDYEKMLQAASARSSGSSRPMAAGGAGRGGD